jgi:hypothetical protein
MPCPSEFRGCKALRSEEGGPEIRECKALRSEDAKIYD